MLKVIGAGLGRTGTKSLKLALEHLLDEPCYHMVELFSHPEHLPLWHAAAQGETIDWSAIFAGYSAAVDWPTGAFWPELSAFYPEALIVLSVRPAEAWWRSASATIFPKMREAEGEWRAMMSELLKNRFTLATTDRAACIAAFNQHNQQVRQAGLGDRLVEWQTGDGWEPLCQALGLPVPSAPFPHVNSTEAFLQDQG
ncbi:sulfotransferase family protein [Almyronema epifaneia]|uniref:Sulfotransferase family protein n=1 Tax=Almyronema epifaneia S1 TaxID=2991925 RepID=A0ABW6IKL2_9CYAN